MMRAIRSLPLSRRNVVMGTGAFFMSGCALLSKPGVPQLYLLRPQMAAQMGPPARWRLSVGTPDAGANLDTTRIALTRSAVTMDYFANAAWSDRLSLIVQRNLIQAFDASGRIASVDRESSGLEIDYLLETDIHDFQARYDSANAAPQVVVGIQAKLVRMPEREIVGSLDAIQQAQASGNSIDAIVLAFNQASGAALSQIVAWTLNRPGPPSNPA